MKVYYIKKNVLIYFTIILFISVLSVIYYNNRLALIISTFLNVDMELPIYSVDVPDSGHIF